MIRLDVFGCVYCEGLIPKVTQIRQTVLPYLQPIGENVNSVVWK